MIKVYKADDPKIPEYYPTGELYTKKRPALNVAERTPMYAAVIQHNNFGPYNETFFEPVILVHEPKGE